MAKCVLHYLQEELSRKYFSSPNATTQLTTFHLNHPIPSHIDATDMLCNCLFLTKKWLNANISLI